MTTPEPRQDGPSGGTDKRRRCFVISPIGQEGSAVRYHADDVLKYIIRPALKGSNVDAIRSDEIAKSGTITEQMFGEIVVGTDKTAQELADEYQPQLDEL